MGITIKWPAVTGTIDRYVIQRAPDVLDLPGTFAALAEVPHDLSGPNYDATTGLFSYTDVTGTSKLWYRIRSKDNLGNYSPWTPSFQPPNLLVFPNQIALDHDYGIADALRYLTTGGDPVSGAQIRVFKKIDYDQEDWDAALGKSSTDTNGRWTDPIYVEAGYTYTVQYLKLGEYGPDTTEITVP